MKFDFKSLFKVHAWETGTKTKPMVSRKNRKTDFQSHCKESWQLSTLLPWCYNSVHYFTKLFFLYLGSQRRVQRQVIFFRVFPEIMLKKVPQGSSIQWSELLNSLEGRENGSGLLRKKQVRVWQRKMASHSAHCFISETLLWNGELLCPLTLQLPEKVCG